MNVSTIAIWHRKPSADVTYSHNAGSGPENECPLGASGNYQIPRNYVGNYVNSRQFKTPSTPFLLPLFLRLKPKLAHF